MIKMNRYIAAFILLMQFATIYANLSQDDIESIQIIYAPLNKTCKKTPCMPIWFDFGMLRNKCDTIELTKQEIIDIVDGFKPLCIDHTKDGLTDTHGKISIRYKSNLMEQTWIYWGVENIQIGLNGNVFYLTIQFANALNKIMLNHTGKSYFESWWYEEIP